MNGIGNVIREERNARKITINELADELGISVGLLHAIETNKSSMRLDILEKLDAKFKLKAISRGFYKRVKEVSSK